MFNIFRLFNNFYGPSIHFFLFLLSTESSEILPQNLIFKKGHYPLEEATDRNFDVIVIVAFHPLLYEEVILCRVENNLIIAVRELPEYFFDSTKCFQQSALFNFKYPSVGLLLHLHRLTVDLAYFMHFVDLFFVFFLKNTFDF